MEPTTTVVEPTTTPVEPAITSPFDPTANLLEPLVRQAGKTCDWTCSSNCVTCSKAVVPTDATKVQITVDLSGCKGSAVSWACCRGFTRVDNTQGSCTLSQCLTGNQAQASGQPAKCETTTGMTYLLDSTAKSFTIQVHDGQLGGNVACGTSPCCGGAGTSCGAPAVSGVCNYVLQVSQCSGTGPDPGQEPAPVACSTDAQCAGTLNAAAQGPCAEEKCVQGNCVLQAKPAGTTCGTASVTGDCDEPDVCDGNAYSCPNSVKNEGTVCRPAQGLCDKVGMHNT
jgi:hypothetical protein